MKYYLILLLCLSGCGKDSFDDGYTDPEFKVYHDSFKSEMIKRGRSPSSVGIRFGDIDDEYNGYCQNSYYVRINKTYWPYLPDSLKEALIYHELGHCILGKHHSATGIMQSILLRATDYETHRAQYINELFE